MSEKILMKGNEVVAEAAVIAGCRYYFGYPITPQNEVPAYMSRRLPEVGGTFLQAESEVAAINMVFGASAGGARVMTSSSSPGISLKQEGISYLSGARLPAVVVNMMRGGPGLGNIAGAQGDYFQGTRGGGNGDYRTVALGPATVQELADLTIKAFDIADKYRVVVMIMGDGFLGQMAEGVSLPSPSGLKFEKPWALTGAKNRQPNIVASLRLNPEDALEKLNLELAETYKEIEKNETMSESYMTDDADYLLVAYGTSSRICRSALRALRKDGVKVGLFRPISLWPFPKEELRKAASKAKKVLAVEMSMGQMVEDVQLSLNGEKDVDFYGRSAGMLPDIDEIIRRVKSYGK
ncbi:MAG TPA: 3-methyl-2-oxobutanoate dehydrogenase subunit VorB [Sediminispirochaeta sp.]|nr:3-methyl-2-oxobutanoate dehydrogenase subunit VorB [Sediminispirochaeta sp.]